MLFNSLPFLVFFTVVVSGVLAIPARLRWAWLLVASYFFYLYAQPVQTLFLIGITGAVYLLGRAIGSESDPKRKKLLLSICIFLTVAPLVFFKYFNFLNDNIRTVVEGTIGAYPVPALKLIMPLGISFFTFKALSYAVDVYRGGIQPATRAGKFALSIAFFPHILAGPIERPGRFLAQLEERIHIDHHRIVSGLKLMLWGLFVKVIIADRLSPLVNRIYDNPSEQGGLSVLIATYIYAFQIFFDFASYSDMAIGAARILGFETMENFRRPYFSRSVSEFWRRWHITLSTWFRDYVYISLGGNKLSLMGWALAILTVFLVSGLWHGANWTFVIWGALHGLYLIVGKVTLKTREKIWSSFGLANKDGLFRSAIAMISVFHLVAFAWIFFRAASLPIAFSLLGKVMTGWEGSVNFSSIELVTSCLMIAAVLIVHAVQHRCNFGQLFARQPVAVRWAIYAALVLAIINLRPTFQAPFAYMQF